jgi:hypothetical protein
VNDDHAVGLREFGVVPWLRLFDAAELDAVHGLTLASLPGITSLQGTEAIGRLISSAASRTPTAVRSRALDLTTLAWLHLADGAVDECVKAGSEAVDLAGRLSSARLLDRMNLLLVKLALSPDIAELRDLSERVNTLLRERGGYDQGPETLIESSDHGIGEPITGHAAEPLPPVSERLPQADRRDRRQQAPIKSMLDREIGQPIRGRSTVLPDQP